MQSPTGVQQRVDPILFEVIRNALVEATEEMSASLQRTAYSTNIKTRTIPQDSSTLPAGWWHKPSASHLTW